LLSSPLLDDAISAYIGSDNLQLNREARTVERSLVEYLLRTACKTSPFSTLTSVCLGTFEYEQARAGTDQSAMGTINRPLQDCTMMGLF
jgi:hypothetical protein